MTQESACEVMGGLEADCGYPIGKGREQMKVTYQYIVEGGGLRSLGKALSFSRELSRKAAGEAAGQSAGSVGEKGGTEEILLAVRETYLGGEIYASARHTVKARLLREAQRAGTDGSDETDKTDETAGGNNAAWLKELLRKSLLRTVGNYAIFHPDRFVKALEDLCEENGIRILYGVSVLGADEEESGEIRVTFAGKPGTKEVFCHRAYLQDRRNTKASGIVSCRGGSQADTYCIHLMGVPAGRAVLLRSSEGVRAELMPGACGPSHGILAVGLSDQTVRETDVQRQLCLAKKEALNAYRALKKVRGFEQIRPGRFALTLCSYSENPFLPFVCAALERCEEDSREMERENGVRQWGAGNPEKRRNRVPEVLSCDVLIAGGGTAGALAAIHAARMGADTVLVEMNKELGGTGTVGGVSTYWFGRRFADVREVDKRLKILYEEYGLPMKPGIWGDQDDFHPGLKSLALTEMCLEAGVRILPDTCIYRTETDAGEDGQTIRISGVYAVSPSGIIKICAGTVIDATGDGDLAVSAGADFCYGSPRDSITYWASLAQYPTPERYKNNFSSCVMVSDMEDYTRFIRTGRKRRVAAGGAWPKGCEAFDHGTYVSVRESRHIRGVTEISLKDTVTARDYPDAVYTVFSNYDPKGKLSADMVYAGVLPHQAAVLAPLAALLPVSRDGRRIKGLVIAGKAISCTHNGFPALRMQPDLMHQGAVIGMLAGYAAGKKITIEEIPHSAIRRLVREKTGDPLTLSSEEEAKGLADILDRFDKNTRTHWVDLGFTEEVKGVPDAIRIMTAESAEILPLLRERFRRETRKEEKAALAGFLLWHGSGEGAETLLSSIREELDHTEGLPVRQGSSMCAQLLPDHGVMPEIVYRLNLLAWYRTEGSGETDCGVGENDILKPFETILRRLERGDRDYGRIEKGIFHYIESFAYVAERSGNRGFAPMLERLSAFEEFQEALRNPEESSILTERLLILYLIVRRAQARLGDIRGYRALAGLLRIPVLPIADSAYKELLALAGGSLKDGETPGRDGKAWIEWIEGRELPVMRITEKVW